MSLPVRFSAEAALELEAAAAWYERQRPGLGAAFIDAVDGVLHRVSDWPESGAATDVDGVRRVPVSRFPYHLPYLIHAGHVRVLAVAHDRRRPEYWAERAGEKRISGAPYRGPPPSRSSRENGASGAALIRCDQGQPTESDLPGRGSNPTLSRARWTISSKPSSASGGSRSPTMCATSLGSSRWV